LSRKSKAAAAARSARFDAKGRLRQAMAEGRFMQALELARQIYKADATPQNREALFDACLGRGRQLRSQAKLRDAATVLLNAVQLQLADPARLGQLAEELALCGEVGKAFRLLESVPDSPIRAQVLNRAVDTAVQLEAAGRSILPEEFHSDFGRILQAFAQLEAGQDEAVRETLQAVGLRSPFMEWKLFLRGLQAYYQGDSGRAVENWQRLSPDRLPARLAAPLRARIDTAYRHAQPAELQAVLQRQGDRLQDSGVVPLLRSIQAALAREGNMHQAWRSVESALRALRKQAPNLIGRLAQCFYWALPTAGGPRDLDRYLRIFGPLSEDPKGDRVRALALEHAGEPDQALLFWKDYEQWIATNPPGWSPEEAQRARALLWLHMGELGTKIAGDPANKDLPEAVRQNFGLPADLKVSPEEAFRRSIELAPDLLSAYEKQFRYLTQTHQLKEAEKAGKQLLERFPEHVPTLEELARVLAAEGKHDEALVMLQRAVKIRPLDRSLQVKVRAAYVQSAHAKAAAGNLDAARQEFQIASEFIEHRDDYFLYCQWAACEFKAGEPARADELIARAQQAANCGLAVSYLLLVEAIRLKLPRALKAQFESEFKEGLESEPTPDCAAALAKSAASLHTFGISYTGQKKHEKMVLGYLTTAKALIKKFSEEQLVATCEGLLELKAIKLVREYCKKAAARFRKSPIFSFLEAESYFTSGGISPSFIYQARRSLETAKRRAQKLPADEARQQLLEKIEDRLQKVDEASFLPFSFFFGGNDFPDLDGVWEEDDWEDDDEDEF
jgi:tetratricopeptide (TPR) repeat protein